MTATTPLRILQIAWKAEITGGEIVVLDLVKGMLRRGHTVHVAAQHPGALLEAATELGAEHTAIFNGMRKTFSWGAGATIAAYVREHKIDVIQSHGTIPNILSRLARRSAPACAHVSTEHLTLQWGRGGQSPAWRERIRVPLYRWMDNWTSRYSQRVVCVSDAVRDDRAEQGIDPAKLLCIPNGVDLDRFAFLDGFNITAQRRSLGLNPNAPVLGTVSRLSPQKDVAMLLAAMPAIWERVPDTQCVVVGNGPLQEALTAQARALDPDGARIFLTGYRKDSRQCIAAMDIFCLTSRWEGMPLVVMEAMACAKPLICTPVPGTLQAVAKNETARVVAFGNSAALAVAASELLEDASLRQQMGAAGRARLDSAGLTTDRVVEQVLEVYRQALAEARPR